MGAWKATTSLHESVERSARILFDYCKKNDWAGFDPYDALNSRLFAITPFSRSKICRILFTQIMKRLPVNIRPLLSVPKGQNPKAIALFLAGGIKLSRLGLLDQVENHIGVMTERLVSLRSEKTPYWSWGYNFPWQTRTILVPRGTPNLVCTTFAANALLDAYEASRESRYLNMAASAAEYILNELYWTDGGSVSCFAYPLPSSRTKVHNANFLGSALLCRVYRLCGDEKFIEPALKVARYSASMQQDDGSWYYGELPTQRWIDNFHTGYNLCALKSLSQSSGTSEFAPNINSGFNFYKEHFFTEDGAPKYFHDRIYPIDIHSVAQSIITPLTLNDRDMDNIELAYSVFRWALQNMWDESGYFHYQIHRYFKIKISYLRWSQSWMLLALSTLLEHCDNTALGTHGN